jgi:hypothetical protein
MLAASLRRVEGDTARRADGGHLRVVTAVVAVKWSP